ncbi:MAG TPA: spore germination protein [Clostridia bacterium]|nr:spore germination protein [Clostridia bacterium]
MKITKRKNKVKTDKVIINKEAVENLKPLVLNKNLNDNIERLKKIMNNSFDIKTREFKIGGKNVGAAVMYIENLVNEERILEHVIKPLIIESAEILAYEGGVVNLQRIKDSMISTGEIEESSNFDDLVYGVLSGECLLLIENYEKGLIISAKGYEGRNITEADVEPSVRGQKEAFIEVLQTNLGLIRRRIRDPNLTFEEYKVGRRSKNSLVMAYVKGIVKEDLVEEVRKKITAINVDDDLTTGQVFHYLTEKESAIFPLVQLSQRVDKITRSMLEGRIAIIAENFPMAGLVPVTLPMLMQAADEYYEKWLLGTLIRIIRYVGLLISTLLPALYIAITSFNPSLLPTNLVLSIAVTRGGVPFPAFLEAFLMDMALELLQQAGIRLPRAVGQTVSIVGGLVVGQAAVEAGVISPIMVVVIGLTAIASFSITDYGLSLASRILRVPFMLLATVLGIYGVALGVFYLLGYLCSLESFGVKYMEPLTFYNLKDQKDALIRAPQEFMKKRPKLLNPEDSQRQLNKKDGGGSEK